MNRTEGDFTRARRGRRGSQTAARQKEYFSNARMKATASRLPVSISFLPFKVDPLDGCRVDDDLLRSTPNTSNPSLLPINSIDSAPQQQSRSNDHRSISRKTAEVSHLLNSRPRDNGFSSVGTKRKPAARSSVQQSDGADIEAKRLKLLQKYDWARVNIQKDLAVHFPGNAGPASNDHRDMPPCEGAQMSRFFERVSNKASNSLPFHVESRHIANDLTGDLRIQIGHKEVQPGVGEVAMSGTDQELVSSLLIHRSSVGSPHPHLRKSRMTQRPGRYYSGIDSVNALTRGALRAQHLPVAHTDRCSIPTVSNWDIPRSRVSGPPSMLYVSSSSDVLHAPTPNRRQQMSVLDSPSTFLDVESSLTVQQDESSTLMSTSALERDRAWETFAAPVHVRRSSSPYMQRPTDPGHERHTSQTWRNLADSSSLISLPPQLTQSTALLQTRHAPMLPACGSDVEPGRHPDTSLHNLPESAARLDNLGVLDPSVRTPGLGNTSVDGGSIFWIAKDDERGARRGTPFNTIVLSSDWSNCGFSAPSNESRERCSRQPFRLPESESFDLSRRSCSSVRSEGTSTSDLDSDKLHEQSVARVDRPSGTERQTLSPVADRNRGKMDRIERGLNDERIGETPTRLGGRPLNAMCVGEVKAPTAVVDKNDADSIWKMFVYGDDCDEDIEATALDTAKCATARDLVPSDELNSMKNEMAISIAQATSNPRPFDLRTTLSSTPLGTPARRKSNTSSSPPLGQASTHGRETVSGLSDYPSIGATAGSSSSLNPPRMESREPRFAGAVKFSVGQNVSPYGSPGATSTLPPNSVGDIASNAAQFGSSSDLPVRHDVTFSRPRLFEGRLVCSAEPAARPLVARREEKTVASGGKARTVRHAKERMGARRRGRGTCRVKSSDGRANIRGLPDIDGDSIEG
jgi:hypothetical protein